MVEPPASPAQRSRPVRRYHFHTPGLLYVGVTLFLAVGAINSQNNLLFSALGLAIGGLLVSGILSGASLLGLRMERLPTPPGSVGSPLALRYSVTNANRFFPAFGLHVIELDEAHATPGGAPSWRKFFPQPRAFVVHAGPKQTAQATSRVIPRRRGELRLGAVQIWSTFPFGLAKKSVSFAAPLAIPILPPELPLRRGLVAHLTARADQGFAGDRDPGSGDEFYGLREYLPGDSPRRIAWKRSARTGDPVVRIHAAPTPKKLWVVLDLIPPAPGAPGEAAQERAIALGAAIIRESGAGGISVGLAVPAAKLLAPPRSGRGHTERLLAQLAVLDVASAAAAPVSLPVSLRSGACVVVHAGPADGSAGPPLARHLSGADLEQHIQPTPGAAAILAILGDPSSAIPVRPGITAPERAA